MRLLVVLVAGCWTSSPKQPEPIENTATDTAKRPADGHAKVIQRTQTGGVIEVHGERGAAMEEANAAMTQHCGPGNFVIVQEGEEAIGTSGDRTETAWRVHYQCAS